MKDCVDPIPLLFHRRDPTRASLYAGLLSTFNQARNRLLGSVVAVEGSWTAGRASVVFWKNRA